MARHHLESPVVFGVALGCDGSVGRILIKRGEAMRLVVPSCGKVSIHLRGSDGRRTDTAIDVRDGDRGFGYDTLLDLLEQDGDNTDHRTNLSDTELRDEGLLVGLWSSTTTMRLLSQGFEPEFGFSGVLERPLSWQAPKSHGATSFLQCAFDGGPSVIAVCPPYAARVLLIHAGQASPDRPATVVPTFEGDGRLADAYGWFLATGAGDAADTVGETLAKQVLENRSVKLDYDSLVTATQWCLRVGESPKMANRLSKLLEDFSVKPDAKALRLLVAFQNRHEPGADFEKQFGTVLAGFKGDPPRLSATMALLVDWLLPMRAFAKRAGGWTSANDEAFAWMRKLADALIWDVPITAYRGLDPLTPDQDAVLRSGSSAKKKSSDGPFAPSRTY